MIAGIDLLHHQRRGCRRMPVLVALVPALLMLVAACVPVANGQAASTDASSGGPSPGLQDRRDLPGAGAVAFDDAGARIAWASGEEVRELALESGEESVRKIGRWIVDLGFAPDGSLWVVADEVQRWQQDALACSTHGIDADRLLAVDAQGAVIAGYAHSDGQGMLRHQAWLDQSCRQTQESTLLLPKAVTDADADPGAPLGRASLHPPRPRTDETTLPRLDDMPGAKVVAVSADGRWWVVDAGGRRSLWKSAGR